MKRKLIEVLLWTLGDNDVGFSSVAANVLKVKETFPDFDKNVKLLLERYKK